MARHLAIVVLPPYDQVKNLIIQSLIALIIWTFQQSSVCSFELMRYNSEDHSSPCWNIFFLLWFIPNFIYYILTLVLCKCIDQFMNQYDRRHKIHQRNRTELMESPMTLMMDDSICKWIVFCNTHNINFLLLNVPDKLQL